MGAAALVILAYVFCAQLVVHALVRRVLAGNVAEGPLSAEAAEVLGWSMYRRFKWIRDNRTKMLEPHRKLGSIAVGVDRSTWVAIALVFILYLMTVFGL